VSLNHQNPLRGPRYSSIPAKRILKKALSISFSRKYNFIIYARLGRSNLWGYVKMFSTY
jgi:hypothetical protein